MTYKTSTRGRDRSKHCERERTRDGSKEGNLRVSPLPRQCSKQSCCLPLQPWVCATEAP